MRTTKCTIWPPPRSVAGAWCRAEQAAYLLQNGTRNLYISDESHVATGVSRAVWLGSDGRTVACGLNADGQCNISGGLDEVQPCGLWLQKPSMRTTKCTIWPPPCSVAGAWCRAEQVAYMLKYGTRNLYISDEQGFRMVQQSNLKD